MPDPPYYAVIFTNQVSNQTEGYGRMAELMVELAQEQPGFIGVESTRDASGFAITVSYWRDEAAITGWRENVKHKAAQMKGMTQWYDRYQLRVAKIERQYGGPEGRL